MLIANRKRKESETSTSAFVHGIAIVGGRARTVDVEVQGFAELCLSSRVELFSLIFIYGDIGQGEQCFSELLNGATKPKSVAHLSEKVERTHQRRYIFC